ncbi:hypothetical protein [Microbacterium rhizomatis]|nr:hypothetical protein [Microbacterium rhizomatis]
MGIQMHRRRESGPRAEVRSGDDRFDNTDTGPERFDAGEADTPEEN